MVLISSCLRILSIAVLSDTFALSLLQNILATRLILAEGIFCPIIIGGNDNDQLIIDENNEEVIKAMIKAEQETHTVPVDISNDLYIESLQLGINYAESIREQDPNDRRRSESKCIFSYSVFLVRVVGLLMGFP